MHGDARRCVVKRNCSMIAHAGLQPLAASASKRRLRRGGPCGHAIVRCGGVAQGQSLQHACILRAHYLFGVSYAATLRGDGRRAFYEILQFAIKVSEVLARGGKTPGRRRQCCVRDTRRVTKEGSAQWRHVLAQATECPATGCAVTARAGKFKDC